MNPISRRLRRPLPSPAVGRRARLLGRPSGLKGRCRDRCATGLRPALDPGATAAPHRAAARGRRRSPCPPRRRGAQRLVSRPNPYKQSLYGFRGLPGLVLGADAGSDLGVGQ